MQAKTQKMPIRIKIIIVIIMKMLFVPLLKCVFLLGCRLMWTSAEIQRAQHKCVGAYLTKQKNRTEKQQNQ